MEVFMAVGGYLGGSFTGCGRLFGWKFQWLGEECAWAAPVFMLAVWLGVGTWRFARVPSGELSSEL